MECILSNIQYTGKAVTHFHCSLKNQRADEFNKNAIPQGQHFLKYAINMRNSRYYKQCKTLKTLNNSFKTFSVNENSFALKRRKHYIQMA